MKIKQIAKPYKEVANIKAPKHKKPKKPSILFRTIIRLASIPDLIFTRFKFTKERMELASKGPYFILMNHSSFIDLEIASKIFYPKPYCIVSTTDGMVGKEWLMRNIGCIPTQKFVTDVTLIKDILYTLKTLKTSVLMYPEAGYSFDGCTTTLPNRLGVLLKKLNVPVLSVITDGAFLRDPLYNGLQKRKVKVSAKLTCLFTPEELKAKSVEEIDKIIENAFSFDAFKSQKEQDVKINEKFRADGLERVLYKCTGCGSENTLVGKGILLTCSDCGAKFELTEFGELNALNQQSKFSHIPDWYAWQRECVRQELLNNEYSLELPVDIGILTDYKALYMVGEGTLSHDKNGFKLISSNGELEYSQGPTHSYSLNADYFWYEIGDVICIGNKERLYYCFPKNPHPVAKTRLATEELYKICKNKT